MMQTIIYKNWAIYLSYTNNSESVYICNPITKTMTKVKSLRAAKLTINKRVK